MSAIVHHHPDRTLALGHARTYFCISPAVPLRPLYSSTTMPKIASESITRVCVRNLHTTRVGGSFACADFHVTPPFGSSIFAGYPRQAALYVVVRRVSVWAAVEKWPPGW